MQKTIGSRLPPPIFSLGGQYARQQPCLKAKVSQRVRAEFKSGGTIAQGDLTGACLPLVHLLPTSPT